MSGGILHTMAARENIGPVVDDAFREQKTEGQFLIVFGGTRAGRSHHHGQGALLPVGARAKTKPDFERLFHGDQIGLLLGADRAGITIDKNGSYQNKGRLLTGITKNGRLFLKTN
jgi:hypothetical protein